MSGKTFQLSEATAALMVALTTGQDRLVRDSGSGSASASSNHARLRMAMNGLPPEHSGERRGSGASEVSCGELEPCAAEGKCTRTERTNANNDLCEACLAIIGHQRLPVAPITIFQHALGKPRGMALRVHALALHVPKEMFGQTIHTTKQA